MSYRLLLRRGTTAGADGTVILAAGEPGAIIDGTDVTLKVGDGVTQLDDLPGLPLDLADVMAAADSALDARLDSVESTLPGLATSADVAAALAALSGSYMSYVGTYASPIASSGHARPSTAGPVYWICANGVTPSNAEDGDLIWNADA